MNKTTSRSLPGFLKVILLFFAITPISMQPVAAQTKLQERASLNASLNKAQGPASATVYLDYSVWSEGSDVLFAVSFSEIQIHAEAGYRYKNRNYGSEVPGLIELLRKTGGEYPTVHFDIYHGSAKQGSFTYSITARNDLSLLTGDTYRFRTTVDKSKSTGWRLVATGFSNFNYKPTLQWMEFQDLIIKYERDKKDRGEYKELVSQADALYRDKKLEEAIKLYAKASQHYMADSYPADQRATILQQLEKEESVKRFEEVMGLAERYEQQGNYAEALAYYNRASEFGVDNSMARKQAQYMEQKLQDIKTRQEEELKEQQRLEEEKQKEKTEEIERRKEETRIDLEERQKELQRQNEEKEKLMLEELDREERRILEEERQEMLRAQEKERKERAREEERKIEQEQNDRRKWDSDRISRLESRMSFDPLKYSEQKAEADRHFDLAFERNPYEALQLEGEWWDSNPYMEEFRDDLNEPRRREAWKEHQELLVQQEYDLKTSKYYYMEAIQYTDYGSSQHKYLLKRIDMINVYIDSQKKDIKMSREFEEMRQHDVETARAYRVVNRMRDNSDRAKMSYMVLTQDYLYPNSNSTVKGSANALQRQYDFENRLNQADQQLSMDNAVTGYTTNIATNLILDDSRTTEKFGNNAMGLNLFVFSGFASVPVVSNDVPSEGKRPETLMSSIQVMPFVAGGDWWINRSKYWDIGVTGDAMFGVLPFLGYSNSLFSYGGNFKINVGIPAVKLALEADYHARSGKYKYDMDVANAGTSEEYGYYLPPTERILEGEFNYSTLKVGGGLHIDISDAWSDGYLRVLMHAEKPSFYQNFDIKKPVLSSSALVVFSGGFTVSASYAKNYPIAGTAKYSMYTYTDRDLVIVTVGKTWTIGTTKKSS